MRRLSSLSAVDLSFMANVPLFYAVTPDPFEEFTTLTISTIAGVFSGNICKEAAITLPRGTVRLITLLNLRGTNCSMCFRTSWLRTSHLCGFPRSSLSLMPLIPS